MRLPRVDARRFPQRLAVAFAASIFFHELIAGLWPNARPQPPGERVVSEVVTVSRRTPSPSTSPVPRATPHLTPAPHYSLAPKVVVRAPAAKAAASPAPALGGAAARMHPVLARPVPARPAPPVSLVEGTHSGRQNGGTGSGAGAGAGTGGLAGTGSGTGTSGNGNAGDADTAPCGDIYLLPGDLTYRKDGAAVQEVVAKVVLRDGSVEIGKFPYPFVYPGEAQNPFRHDVGLAKNGGIPVQMPPDGTDFANLPSPVQVVLKHTNPTTGATDLPECAPQATP
jgi:hypothetical protein